MATSIRYGFEVLLHLKESPLCVKPKDLPPKEEWMGPPPEPPRPQNKVPTDRTALLDQPNRRPVAERNLSRNGGGKTISKTLNVEKGSRADDYKASDAQFLGPKMNFPSGSLRGEHDRNDKTPRDPDARDRFARSKIGGDDTNDRFRDPRTNNANYRRRGDGDRDTEGWSTVKPRKSFGQDGAERFTGRMGGDRHRDDRAPRERDDLDATKDRPRRNFDTDGEDTGDLSRRNVLNRGRSELWFKDGTNTSTGTGTGAGTKVNDTNERISNRERIEKAKSWRERNDDANLRNDRANDRYDRRWDRDREQRPSERDPEWMDEPEEEKSHGHTEADLKKFMESMKASRGAAKTSGKAADTPGPSPAPASFFSDPPAVKSAPAVERGPDKFFEAFGPSQLTPSTPVGGDRPDAGKATTGKSSRFANLFSTQVGDPRGQTEPPTPAAGPPPPMPVAGSPATQAAQQNNAEKEAFQALLQKLHLPRQGGQQATPTPPNAGAFAQPPPQNMAQDPIQNLAHALAQKAHLSSPDQADHFGMDRREEPRLRSVPPVGPEILAPQPMPPPSQPHSARPDQVLQDLLSQRHTAQSQGSGRIEHNSKASRDFLMQLMQSGRHAPDPPRIEQIMRMPQPQRQASIPQFHEREPDFVQQRGPVQQRQMRPPGPPGFVEEQFRHAEGDVRPMHPTQILQRPPGLDHAMQQPPQPFMQPGQQVHPGPRPMIPPPGLMGNPPRNVPMPAMFNPSIPPGVFPPDNLPGPPRNMQPPPGFFGGGPIPPPVIPGHLPPPGMMGGFPGPEAMGFPGPFVDARGGMPPPGVGPYRR